MSKNTLAVRLVHTGTNEPLVIHYPAHPLPCDSITLVSERDGSSVTLTAKAFEKSSVDVLAAMVGFMGGLKDGYAVFEVQDIPGYRFILGTEDIQFAVLHKGQWWETVYWHIDELTEDATLVLGAICGAFNSVDEVDEADGVLSAIA